MTSVPIADTGVRLRADPSRLVTRFFVPGREDSGPGDSRATPVVERILAIDELTVGPLVADLDERFSGHHRDLHATFLAHADMISTRVPHGTVLTPARQLLLGASFTHEYSIEGAALCNPSIVVAPDQPPEGPCRFVMSVRCIGEGHRSSIGFRTGTISDEGVVTVDEPGIFCETNRSSPGANDRSVFHASLSALNDDHENAAKVLDALPDRFSDEQLEMQISLLESDSLTRRNTANTIGHLRDVARASYVAHFNPSTSISERVLWPQTAAESHGMEDARFVQFTSDAGERTYCATYTAYDGANISQQLLETTNFERFTSTPLAGPAAAGKGLALFPRKIHGRYAALSRSDRETNSIAFSTDIHHWPTSETIQVPTRPWEILQLGNCGSPIETERGWLVLTHGVGPMRTYTLAAILLDIDEPRTIIGRSPSPILEPGALGSTGYVPNVVYSCGALARHDTLVLPYGIADQSIGIATLSISNLLDTMI